MSGNFAEEMQREQSLITGDAGIVLESKRSDLDLIKFHQEKARNALRKAQRLTEHPLASEEDKMQISKSCQLLRKTLNRLTSRNRYIRSCLK